MAGDFTTEAERIRLAAEQQGRPASRRHSMPGAKSGQGGFLPLSSFFAAPAGRLARPRIPAAGRFRPGLQTWYHEPSRPPTVPPPRETFRHDRTPAHPVPVDFIGQPEPASSDGFLDVLAQVRAVTHGQEQRLADISAAEPGEQVR